MNGLTFTPNINETQELEEVSAKSYEIFPTKNKPLIPNEIPKKEFEDVDVDPDQVQIECMIDKDGKEVKKVKPILIKKEITTNYATQVPFELGPDEDIFFFTDEERVPYADCPYEPKIEE